MGGQVPVSGTIRNFAYDKNELCCIKRYILPVPFYPCHKHRVTRRVKTRSAAHINPVAVVVIAAVIGVYY
jgi:hypothetical protein